MPLKGLSPFLESGRDEELCTIAVTADVNVYRQLSETVRGQLFSFFKRSGIPEYRIILLNMMLETKHPDLLVSKKLDETIDEIRGEILQKIMLEDQKRKVTPANAPKAELVLAPDPHRLLSYKELGARFRRLKVDLQEIIYDFEAFYFNSRFGDAVAKSMDQKEYRLIMPAVTDRAMKALEKAYAQGRINSFMIDDARVGDGNALRAFEIKTMKRFRRKNRFSSMEETEAYLNKSTVTPPIIRFVGFNRNETVFDPQHRGSRLKQQTSQEPYQSTIGLGTYLRLCHYLNFTDPEGLEMITHYVTKGSRILAPLTVVLNNKTADDNVLTIGSNDQDPNMRNILKKAPVLTEVPDLFEMPMHIMTSDDLGFIQNSGHSRYIAHMSTWPAPPNDEGQDGNIPF